MTYAIVDIETTGGYADANGITEIAIYIFDGKTVVDSYVTLINPIKKIPGFIESFTGINDTMVKDAPVFADVAEKVHQLLHDKVFVAHSVNFDYSFIKSQLAANGFELNCKKLCTIRLSRKILPGYRSYSLGNICDSLDIKIENRHRAGGDALATVALFKFCLEKDVDGEVGKSLMRNSGDLYLPPNLDKRYFDQLPYQPGVYYFLNEKGKIIYIGKAKNIKHRVRSHFSNNATSRQKQNLYKNTYRIDFEIAGTELIAQILESLEIKKHQPVFNVAQKRFEPSYGFYTFNDANGYIRLIIEKRKKSMEPLSLFHNLIDAKQTLKKLIDEHCLCPKLCFYQKEYVPCQSMENNSCYGACEGQESVDEYNLRVKTATDTLLDKPSFAILDAGTNDSNQSCILILKGVFWGMGYIDKDIAVSSVSDIQLFISHYPENHFGNSLIMKYAAANPHKVLEISVS